MHKQDYEYDQTSCGRDQAPWYESMLLSILQDLESTLENDHIFKSSVAVSRLEADADEKKL